MLLSREELQKMSPIEAEYVYAYILELYREKVTPDTTNYENLNASVTCCPRCGSTHVIKWDLIMGRRHQDRDIYARTAGRPMCRLRAQYLPISIRLTMTGSTSLPARSTD